MLEWEMNDSMFESIALSLHDSHVKAGSVGLATVTRNVVQSRGLYLIEEAAAAQKAGRRAAW